AERDGDRGAQLPTFGEVAFELRGDIGEAGIEDAGDAPIGDRTVELFHATPMRRRRGARTIAAREGAGQRVYRAPGASEASLVDQLWLPCERAAGCPHPNRAR